MLRTLMAFWQAHKGRSKVVGALAPYMARWRQDGGTDAELQAPTALGFLSTLVAALARQHCGDLGPDALGVLQADVWAQLTGLPADDLGETVVALSIAGDPQFVRGCSAALRFADVLARLHETGMDGLGSTVDDDTMLDMPLLAAEPNLAALWACSIAGGDPA